MAAQLEPVRRLRPTSNEDSPHNDTCTEYKSVFDTVGMGFSYLLDPFHAYVDTAAELE